MLDNALDYGITEERFWDMQINEIQRAIQSKIRVNKIEAQEKASYDYIQAQLIVKGISKLLGDEGEFPSLQEVYSGLFNEEIIEQQKEEKQINESVNRFLQFAQSHNKKLKSKEVAKDK